MTPYAGLEFANYFREEDVPYIVHGLKEFLKTENIQRCIIKQAPEFFHPASASLRKELTGSEFQINKEINHHIVLEESLQKIDPMQMRRIRKCQQAGFRFEKVKPDSAEAVHQFLSKCRQQQGIQINIDIRKFINLTNLLPNDFEMYSVRNSEGTTLAALVTIAINESVVYSYLPAFDRAFSEYSPLTYLFYEYFQLAAKRFKVLDLGISSIHGKPQTSLIQFKQRMGGIPSDRYVFQIDLD